MSAPLLKSYFPLKEGFEPRNPNQRKRCSVEWAQWDREDAEPFIEIAHPEGCFVAYRGEAEFDWSDWEDYPHLKEEVENLWAERETIFGKERFR